MQTLQGGIGFTSCLTFGLDEDRDPVNNADVGIYTAHGSNGTIHRVCFDADNMVTGNTVLININGAGQAKTLVGITFDPGYKLTDTQVCIYPTRMTITLLLTAK